LSPPAGPAIRVEGLTKMFPNGVRALCGLDLEVARGEVFGLLGPNGAGKTTTVRLLNGTLTPTSGRSWVLGESPAAGTVRRLTATVTEEALMYDLPPQTAAARSEELLTRLGLAERREDKLGSLSTGLKKRAQLARALLHRPDILILDEPTSGLDAEAALEVTALIRRLASEQRVTVLLCTHNLFLAERICDSFAFLSRGELRARGRKEELIRAEPGELRVEIRTLEARRTLPCGDLRQIDALVREVQAQGEHIVAVRPLEPTLEEVYLRYVGRRSESA